MNFEHFVSLYSKRFWFRIKRFKLRNESRAKDQVNRIQDSTQNENERDEMNMRWRGI